MRPASSTAQLGFIVQAQAAGANKVFFDLFNETGVALSLESLKAIKDGSVAVAGQLSMALFLTRTTAIGTGGVAHVDENLTLPMVAPSIFETNPDAVALPGLTLRSAPSGGATAGAILARRDVFSEETNAASYPASDFFDPFATSAPILIPSGTGIRVIQGAVASVGNVAFEGRLQLA